ncbi:MAG: TatD family hydrolase [Azoarcus sp.]|nr:TatD family hydrolase [Azoarcus sp.]
MLIDTHLHLDATEFDPDRDSLLAEARVAGVAAFVVPAVDRASFGRVLALAAREPDVFAALGIHPLYVEQAGDDDLAALDALLGRASCVAVGEIGLDHYLPGSTAARARQEAFFVAQLELARRHALPVVLHVRRAQDVVLKYLRRVRVAGGIAHAFNGSRQQADAFIALGFKLGFGGAMTFEGSRRIRRLAVELPLGAIVLETDAPDMTPAWGRGRNLPANLARYAITLAGLRRIDVAELIRATGENARAALGLPGVSMPGK